MNSSGLAALIAPHSKAEFIKSHWPSKPFVVHGLNDSIQPLLELPFLQSLDDLLNHWPHTIQAHLPDVSDESSSIDTNARDAQKLFSNQMALLFNNVQDISPVLREWLQSLRDDLGLPNATYARCMIYATPDARGNRAHFDENVNFVLQIHGTKKWTLAPNTSVQNPTQRYTVGQQVDPELEAYIESPLPNEMPIENREEVILKSGSMLFVPRGYWHCTEAEGEALALNFTFSQPTWIDLFTLALRSRLSISAEWRELADGVTSIDPERRENAQRKFDALLMDLTDDLPNWRAQDILGATEGDR